MLKHLAVAVGFLVGAVLVGPLSVPLLIKYGAWAGVPLFVGIVILSGFLKADLREKQDERRLTGILPRRR